MLSLIAPLFRPSFWFDLQTQPFSVWSERLLFVLILVCLGAGIYAIVRAPAVSEKALRRVWRRVGGCFLSAGISGLVLFFFTWQRIPVLGMRFWWLVWFLSHLAWGVRISMRAKEDLPKARRVQAERQAYEKWLPKAKK